MSLAPINDNFLLLAPKQLDTRWGRFSGGAWRPYNDMSEFMTIQAFGARYETQLVFVRSTTNALRSDIFILDKNKDPYLLIPDIDLTNYYTKDQINGFNSALNSAIANAQSDASDALEAIASINETITTLQPKTDNGLNTTSKTIVGGINEVKAKADSADAKAIVAQENAEDAYNEALAKIPLAQKDAVGGVPSINNVYVKTTYAGIRALSGSLKSNNYTTTDNNGEWYYDSTDTTSTDNGGTILVTSDGKRIKRYILDDIDLVWFNPIKDSDVDNSTVFQLVFNIASGLNKNVVTPAGIYRCKTAITMSGVSLVSNGTTILNGMSTGVLLTLGSNTNIEGLNIDGGLSLGVIAVKTNIRLDTNASNINLHKCNFKDSLSNTLIGVNNKNISIRWCKFDNNTGNISFADGGENIVIEYNNIANSQVSLVSGNPTNAITFNKNNNNQVYKNCRINKNNLKTISRMGIECFNMIDSEVSGNFLDDVSNMGMSFPLLRNSLVSDNIINDIGLYAIELPGVNGRNRILSNVISKPKGSLSDGIIISSFSTTALIGSVDNKYNRVEGNTFDGWQNDLGTKNSIKILNGDNSSTVLDCGFTIVNDNVFINSGGIVFENTNSSNQTVRGNVFNLRVDSISISTLISLRGANSIVEDNKVIITMVVTTPLRSCIAFTSCANSTIRDNNLRLNSGYTYGIGDGVNSADMVITDNDIIGATITPVYAKTAGTTVKIYRNNGQTEDYRDIPVPTSGATEVISYASGQILTGQALPEGLVTAKLSSIYILATSRTGTASTSIGTAYIKNYQSGSADTNTGWSLIAAPIIDNVLTAPTANFANIVAKYTLVKYPVGTQFFFPLFEGGTGALYLRMADSVFLKINPKQELYLSDTTATVTKTYLNTTYPIGSYGIGTVLHYYAQGMDYTRISAIDWTFTPTNLVS